PEVSSSPVEIVLRGGATLSGVVRALDSTPVAGARVSLRWFLSGVSIRREGSSDAEGNYQVVGLPWDLEPHRFLVEATSDGYAPVTLSRVPEPDTLGIITQDLYLTRGATIDGIVRDRETGAPIPGARIILWTSHENTTLDQVRPYRDLIAGPDG